MAQQRASKFAGAARPRQQAADAVPVTARRWALRLALVRLLIVVNLLLATNYMVFRYLHTMNWAAWPLSIGLLVAETYSYGGAWLFGLQMWRWRVRPAPPPPPPGATVDVFITCYNEPVELVRETTRAAVAIRYPHRTYVLDDGGSPEMAAMAAAEGAGYLVRSADWQGRPRHAKAGNLNNALLQTDGEFFLVLDADQIPYPAILDHTLGYFRDPAIAFVQTPQWFYNVPPGDPFGCRADLFYGPIQQGKDGWNAAFFCGSNAVLRREALMQLGIVTYVRDVERRVRRGFARADRVLRAAERHLASGDVRTGAALGELRAAVRAARWALAHGEPAQEVTWRFQRDARAIAGTLVSGDLAGIRAELAEIPGLDLAVPDVDAQRGIDNAAAFDALANRDASPLAAIESVGGLLRTLDMDRADEAQPVMPLATISVTEDMATAMRLHALGWRSVYHDEVLARGLAPEDLRSALQQRLRWAQGTLQVLLRENPLTLAGLSVGQRLMYLSTMWSYLSGFATVLYLAAPIAYLGFGISPVRSFEPAFFLHLIPYLIVNQALFVTVGWGRPTMRGQQYNLALFPLWIKAVTTAVGSVYFGRSLGFVVTPKSRQAGIHYSLVRPQIIAMALLVMAALAALLRVAFGLAHSGGAILANLAWVGYLLLMLSVIVRAAVYTPAGTAPSEAVANGRGAVSG
ncbi:MAG TPA: glycosyltransferase [Dehalococcoidia bacterium]|nr:glycosyltransferase [Dehalococcoidia bacterium]